MDYYKSSIYYVKKYLQNFKTLIKMKQIQSIQIIERCYNYARILERCFFKN